MFKGFFSAFKTQRFIRKIKKNPPDVIHLHNLHGSFINIPILFRYIKKNSIPVVWTLHDCWAFTAICSHFSLEGCSGWIDGCGSCPQRKKLSSAFFDFSHTVWKLKKKHFTSLNDVTVVTPSEWLSGLVKKSFLNCYDVTTVYNGIDLNAFKPTESSFRKNYRLYNKFIVLGVSFNWGYSKGLDVFVELSKSLPENFAVVLVGADGETSKNLPDNIITIGRTNNISELAEIYSAADVFVNPTREEVLGLVNIESLACGTPVVTFNTGGSPECIDETCGEVIDFNNTAKLQQAVERICTEQPYSAENCRKRALLFDKDDMLKKYIDLYKSKVGNLADC
ncbi:MAG: glycosyltransferase [Acutalibacteraceae bacterium]